MKFSVSIPAYKRTFLKECIDSILSQTYKDYEIIIVDDASPEKLNEVVSEYNDPRIHYYKNDRNYGAVEVVDNWNKCLEYARGDYFICMGDDDRLLPNCLEVYSKLIEKNPGLGLYHAWTEIINEESTAYDIQDPRPLYESALSLLWNRWSYRSKQYIGDFLFDTQYLKKNGGFVKFPLAWSSDDMSAVLAATKGGCANTQEVCFQYRVNKQTISNTGNNSLKVQALVQYKEHIQRYLSSINVNKLPVTDRTYYNLLTTNIDAFFRKRYYYHISWDIRQNPVRFFYWLRKCDDYGLTRYSYVKLLIKSVIFVFDKRKM